MAKSSKNNNQKWFSNSLGVEWTRELGQRLKMEYKIYNGYDDSFDLQALAEICGHANNASYMNRIFRGNDGAVLREDAARELAEKWGINWQYLFGVGSRTPSDAEKELIAENKAAIEYLRTLGIELTPGYYWVFNSKYTSHFMLDSLKSYISSDDFAHLQNILTTSSGKNAREYVRLLADPSTDPKINEQSRIRIRSILNPKNDEQESKIQVHSLRDLDSLTKSTQPSGNFLQVVPRLAKFDFHHELQCGAALVDIMYELKIDGKFQKVVDLQEFKNIIGNVDRMARAAALSALEIQY